MAAGKRITELPTGTDDTGLYYVMDGAGGTQKVAAANAGGTAIAAHNDDATAHGLHVYNVETFGTISDTDPVSHLAIQAAIDAAFASGGGTVVLPPQKILIGATIVPRSGVALRGSGVSFGSTGECYDLGMYYAGGTCISYPDGIVFKQATSGYSLVHYLTQFNLENLGFDDCATIFSCGARSHNGLAGSVFRNLYATNITDWAFDIGNFQHIRFDNVMVDAKGGMHLWVDLRSVDVGNSNIGPGNSTFVDFFCEQPASGTLYDGILIDDVAGNDGLLASLTFLRPQVNRFNPAATTTSNIKINPAHGKIPSISFIDIDVEGWAASGVSIANVTRSNFVLAGATADPARTPWAIEVSNSSGVTVHSCQVDAKMRCLDPCTAATTFASGYWGQAGESNLHPFGTYRDAARGANSAIFQFGRWDSGCLIGTDFTVAFAQTLDFKGAKIKRRTSSVSTTSTIPDSYASDTVKLTTAGISVTVPNVANVPDETTRYINTSAGSVTIIGVTGGDITLAAGSVADVQAISGAWYLVNKQGS